MNTNYLKPLPVSAIALAIAGCAGMETNQSLEQARAAVRNANNDPVAVEAAAVELERARDALAAAERIYESEGNDELERLEHQSYLAQRYADVAIALANETRADEELESAEAERNRVLLEVRTAEAELRERQAEAATVAAARNQQEAEAARLAALRNQRQAEAATAAAVRNEREARAAQQRADAAETEARALAEQLDDLEAQRTDRGIVLTLGDVLFDVDKAELQPGANSTISQLAEFLNAHPERELVIEGHTDSTGPEAYNVALSQNRASAVAMALEQRGVPGTRLETRGLGESEPVASNETTAGRQQNRRVEVIVSD